MSRKPFLLDVNVLIALAWPSHVHHRAAHDWFSKRSSLGWATCSVTQLGFVRVSSNPSIIKEAVTPKEALLVLQQMTLLKHHVFWNDAELFIKDISWDFVMGHRQVTDAYLLGLSRKKGCKLATLDRKLVSLIAPQHSTISDEVLELIPCH